MPSPVLKFMKLRPDAILPTKGTSGAAAYDLYAVEPVIFRQNRLVNTAGTGLRIEVPPGYVGLVCSRSGLASNQKIFVVNAPGVIDEDYRGELKVILGMLPTDVAWPSFDATVLQPGSRIAQLMLMPVTQLQIEETANLSTTERGVNGLGSTGI